MTVQKSASENWRQIVIPVASVYFAPGTRKHICTKHSCSIFWSVYLRPWPITVKLKLLLSCLSSQTQSIAGLWSSPSYAAWWQRSVCVWTTDETGVVRYVTVWWPRHRWIELDALIIAPPCNGWVGVCVIPRFILDFGSGSGKSGIRPFFWKSGQVRLRTNF